MDRQKVVDLLIESGVNRIKHWIDQCDIACISACRWRIKDITKGTNPVDVERYNEAVAKYKALYGNENLPQDFGVDVSKKENEERTRQMKAYLVAKGYGVTEITGSYIEGFGSKNQHEVGEKSFFVVNLKNSKNFLVDIFKISEFFNQDSVLLKPKGEPAYLIGTNNAEWPGYGEKSDAKNFHALAGRFMSRIGNAAFSFANDNNLVMRKNQNDVHNGDEDDYEHEFLYHSDDRPSFQTRKNDRINDKNENIKYTLSSNLIESFNRYVDNYFLYIKETQCKGFALQNLYECARKVAKGLKEIEESRKH